MTYRDEAARDDDERDERDESVERTALERVIRALFPTAEPAFTRGEVAAVLRAAARFYDLPKEARQVAPPGDFPLIPRPEALMAVIAALDSLGIGGAQAVLGAAASLWGVDAPTAEDAS